MYLAGGSATMPQTYRRRRRPAHCDHRSAPVVVSSLPGGFEAQCLVCGTLGPVREESGLARSALLAERDDYL